MIAAGEIAPADVAAALAVDVPEADRPVLLDCREPAEWAASRIAGAVHLPLALLPTEIASVAPDRSRPVVVYCHVGMRSTVGARILASLGYEASSMTGGIERWEMVGLPVEVGPPGRDGSSAAAGAAGLGGAIDIEPAFTPDQRRRYARQMLMPEVGPEGQARLLRSRVLVVGAGGLGSPALLYLAGAGVGTIRVVDFDVVDPSNLQRQVVHTTDSIGSSKAGSAARGIHALDPAIRVEVDDEAVGADNVARLIEDCDVVIDGTDSFETRYLLNDAAVAAGIPVVHASVYRFEGQVTVFAPGGPCYRCLYPEPLPPELAPVCSVAGVLGVVPGIMGLLQANETLKLLLGIGEPLVGRLLLFDALDATMTEVSIPRDPACPACGGR